MRLIDADKIPPLSDMIWCAYEGGEYQAYKSGAEYGRGLVDAAPTIDPESLWPTAHWVETGEYVQTIDAVKIPVKICSGCHMDIALEEFESYCPHCGARMVNGDD